MGGGKGQMMRKRQRGDTEKGEIARENRERGKNREMGDGNRENRERGDGKR